MLMNASKTPKSRNWLLVKSRQWHIWGGLIAAVFLLVASVTGMVLNYKKPVLVALGLEPPPVKERAETKPSNEPRTAAMLNDFPIQYAQALEIASQEFGDAALERIELKREQGAWIYKVKAVKGDELWISASNGEYFLKGKYEKIQRMEAGAPVRSFDWGKVLLDLHTGKIGGAAGQAVMTAVAGLLLWLTLSGLYVYIKPRLARRRNQKQATASPNLSPAAIVSQVGADRHT
jgi:uncharacterized iron-regulated membrane protein